MTKRITTGEVALEIECLRKLVPAAGIHQRRVRDSIDAAIEELESGVDDTTEEFDNEPDIVKD